MWILAVPKGKQMGLGGQPRQHRSVESSMASNPNNTRGLQPEGGGPAFPNGEHGRAGKVGTEERHWLEADDRSWWDVDSFSGVDDGMADRVERIRATGDGQVPAVEALAWRILGENE
jgi:hypothetical protein